MTRTLSLPTKSIPHVEVRRHVAIFRTALADCRPEVAEAVGALVKRLATSILASSPYLASESAATEHAEAFIAEAVMKAENVVE